MGNAARKMKVVQAITSTTKKQGKLEVKQGGKGSPLVLDTEKLILDHRENGRKLARSLLRRWRVRMPSEETDSIVDLTLCEAAKRFNPKHGASFMTFLFYHLRGNLVRSIATAAKANNLVVAFAKTAGMDLTEWAQTLESPHLPTTGEMNIFENRDAEQPDLVLLKKEEIKFVRDAVKQLDELEQEVLTRSYAHDEALIDIADELGYSRCHISRVKRKALEQIESQVKGYVGYSTNTTDKPLTGAMEIISIHKRRPRRVKRGDTMLEVVELRKAA